MKKYIFYIVFPGLLGLATACSNATTEEEKKTIESSLTNENVALNTLTDEEKEEGWKLLFDGLTTEGWHNYNKEGIGSAWRVENGTLTIGGADGKGWSPDDGGDIVTDLEYRNFILQLEWKIEPAGNSGIIYNVIEDPEYNFTWLTGPEMQILDDDVYPYAENRLHRAGALFGIIPCSEDVTNPADQWNHVKLVSKYGNIQHWLNGHKVVDYQLGSDEWNKLVLKSTFKDVPDFAKSRTGRIALQDHDNRVWFRNIKILEL